MLHDSAGLALALGEISEPISLPTFLRFGTGLPSALEVQVFRDRLVTDGVEIVAEWEEPDYVSVKFRDPDGYVVEVCWESEEKPE
jgi:hypothetical protein